MRRFLRYVAGFVAVLGASLMIGMLIWSYRLDADFSGSYACCTQEAVAAFHRQFWVRFFIGAAAAIVGCSIVALLLSRRTAILAGSSAIGAGVVALLLVLPTTNVEGWTGASAMTLIGVLLVGGAASLVIGAFRFGWTALRHRRGSC